MMRRPRFCSKCGQQSLSASYQAPFLRVLCAECNVDERTSSTQARTVEPREVEDRYTALARKHGLAQEVIMLKPAEIEELVADFSRAVQKVNRYRQSVANLGHAPSQLVMVDNYRRELRVEAYEKALVRLADEERAQERRERRQPRRSRAARDFDRRVERAFKNL